MEYLVKLEWKTGIVRTATYKVSAASKTEARKSVPNKRHIVSITVLA